MSKPLSRDEIVSEIRAIVRRGEMASLGSIHDRVCRTDAVGRLSSRDGAYFDAVVESMVQAGEIRRQGPFVFDPRARA